MNAFRFCAVLSVALWLSAAPAGAQTCPEEPTLQTYTGGISSICPCFAAGEEAGAVFNAPAANYPIRILRVGIGWASQFGGTGQTLESGIHVYGAGLPNPGPRLYTLPGPILTDGAINVFDLNAQLGNVVVNSGPFTVTLEFMTSNAGDVFAPSIGLDSGCTPGGKNVIHAIPGGWLEGCSQGLSGDWVIFVIYQRVSCQTGVGDGELIASTRPVILMNPRPNPLRSRSDIDFVLARPGRATISVFDIQGRPVALLDDRDFPAGPHSVSWDGHLPNGERVHPGLYLVRLEANGSQQARKLMVTW